MMIANAFGNATHRPPPPSTSHVSLPSQNGATEFIIWSRSRLVAEERKQDADAEIEAVEHDVERDRTCR